jgi:hypothetical protein
MAAFLVMAERLSSSLVRNKRPERLMLDEDVPSFACLEDAILPELVGDTSLHPFVGEDVAGRLHRSPDQG